MIHAAKRWQGDQFEICHTEPYQTALRGIWWHKNPPPLHGVVKRFKPPSLGCTVAKVTFIDCVEVAACNVNQLGDHIGRNRHPAWESAFGDFSPGRFAWIIGDVERLRPVLWVGRQGFWNLDERHLEQCGCHRCWLDRAAAVGESFIERTMIVCETCGNKRCPHATDHRLMCTGSNESGQTGSRFPKIHTTEGE